MAKRGRASARRRISAQLGKLTDRRKMLHLETNSTFDPFTHSMPISSSVKRIIGQSRVGADSNSARPANIPKRWHAISVQAKALSCAASHELRKKRFLSNEAPVLPLAECTKRASCPCTYKHQDDRRNKPRRDCGSGISPHVSKHGTERRTSRGRRSDD